MGVDVRLHLSFPVLLVAAGAYGAWATHSAMRGVGLWLALVFAVLVREVARSVAAAYVGLRLRAIFLLPIGGVMAFAPEPASTQPSVTPLLIAAPVANFGMGLLLLAMSYACAPGVDLLHPPWISAAHVLRSFVWMQFIVGAVNLLPTAVLPTRQMLRGGAKTETPTARSAGPAFSMMTGLAIAMILAALVTSNVLLLIMAVLALLFSQLQGGGAVETASSEEMRVREVMLTDCVMLSSSDTLRDGLGRAVHSLQDVFPVLRGDRLVGSVSRQTLADQLQMEGDGYLQGIMTRELQTAAPDEALVVALRRAGSRGASEFIPVVEDGRMLGILTPQSLGRAVQQVKQMRVPDEAKDSSL